MLSKCGPTEQNIMFFSRNFHQLNSTRVRAETLIDFATLKRPFLNFQSSCWVATSIRPCNPCRMQSKKQKTKSTQHKLKQKAVCNQKNRKQNQHNTSLNKRQLNTHSSVLGITGLVRKWNHCCRNLKWWIYREEGQGLGWLPLPWHWETRTTLYHWPSSRCCGSGW